MEKKSVTNTKIPIILFQFKFFIFITTYKTFDMFYYTIFSPGFNGKYQKTAHPIGWAAKFKHLLRSPHPGGFRNGLRIDATADHR